MGETQKEMTQLDDLGEKVEELSKPQSPTANDRTDHPLAEEPEVPAELLEKPVCVWRQYMLTGMVLAVANQMAGTAVLFEYAKQLFLVIENYNQRKADAALITLGVFQAAVTSLSCACISRCGRRPVMLVGQALVILALIGGFFSTLLVHNHETITTGLIYLNVLGYSVSLGPILMLYAAEALKGIQPVLFIYWLLSTFLTLISDLLIEAANGSLLFLIFTVFSVATWVYLFLRMPESKSTPRNRLWKLVEGEQDEDESKELRGSRGGEEMVAESNTHIHKKGLEEEEPQPQPHESL